MDEARCGAVCPGKFVPVLTTLGKCSCLRAKPAHIPGHLPGLWAATKRIVATACVTRSDGTDEAELLEGGHAIVQTNLLHDLAICNPQHRGAGEVHLAARRRGPRSDKEVAKGRTGVRAAAFPATNHILTLGNQLSRAPEVEVWERFTKSRHEDLDLLMAPTWLMQRVVQQHVGSSEFVNDAEIARFTPELRKPATDDGLVFAFLRHHDFPFV